MRLSSSLVGVFVIALGVSRSPLFSAYTLDQVISNMEEKEKTVQAVKFNFEQEVDFADVKKNVKVEGRALFSKPKRFHVEKISPSHEMTVSDGKKIWIYSPVHNQVWEDKVKNQGIGALLPKGLAPVNDLMGELKSNFVLTLSTEGQTSADKIRLHATPKDSQLDYKLELDVSADSWFPTQLVYNSDSARVVTKLMDVQFNPDVPKNVFRFIPPRGTDVISLHK